MSRALVLGGGGSTGVAWLVGMLSGLAQGAVLASDCDHIIGTSAGSMVGSRVADGQTLSQLREDMMNRDGALENEAMAGLDFEDMLRVFDAWFAMTDTSPASCQAVAKLALEAKTMSEARCKELLARDVKTEWPARSFTAVAVDAHTGELVTFGNNDKVTLLDAISASICVPGVFAPVRVGDRVLVDGGLRSGTNADLAVGYDKVLVLAPIGSLSDGMDPGARQLAEAEVAMLREHGATVTLVFPDEQANAVIGINRMDPNLAEAVMNEGTRQGAELAMFLAGRW